MTVFLKQTSKSPPPLIKQQQYEEKQKSFEESNQKMPVREGGGVKRISVGYIHVHLFHKILKAYIGGLLVAMQQSDTVIIMCRRGQH